MGAKGGKCDEATRVLKKMGATRMIMGHSPVVRISILQFSQHIVTKNAFDCQSEIKEECQGQLLFIDTGLF